MRIFITATFKSDKNREEIEHLCGWIRDAGFEDFCFIRDVEKYKKIFDNPRDLMARAREEIGKSDALLIDMTAKPTGRAIEAGIAYAFRKKIIVIMREGTKIKDTVRGIADEIIEYDSLDEIVPPLREISERWNADIVR